jgi:hypothetical protein
MSGVWEWFKRNVKPGTGEAPPKVDPPLENVSPIRPKPSAPLLWCPFAFIPPKAMKTSGRYEKGYPLGAVVHHSAGADAGIYEYGLEMGFTYFVINRDGRILQGFPLDRYGSHAGVSKWPGLGESVSSKLVGIEVVSAGKLSHSSEGWKSWFGKYYNDHEVRTLSTNKENIQAGTYHKFTQAQEESLIKLLRWLKENNPSVFSYDYVLGHDEVAGPAGIGYWRKNDPGGSLSMTMPELRKHLKG